MKNKKSIGIKTAFVAVALFFLAISGIFGFLFVNCINLYAEFDVAYSDLMYEELTFVKYETISMGKSGREYRLYFEEYEEPFQVDNISSKKLNKTALDNLTEKTLVKVYFDESSSKKYKYKICDFSSGSTVLLGLDDYIKVNQDNQIVGMIAFPILSACGLFLAGMALFALKLD